MLIAHVSMTPIAGACWSWSETFKEAGYESFCACPRGYSDGRVMPADYTLPPEAEALARIKAADVIICCQGRPYGLPWYPRRRPTLFVYVSQNLPRYITRAGEADGWPWAVIGEYQTRQYPGSVPVPPLMPLGHPWFQPADKPADRVRIVFSPSSRQREGWDDKGVAATLGALRAVSGPGVEVDVIERVPLGECLARKATAHIAIDECKTGSYHYNSLQGLAQGSVTLNNCDELCAANIRQMTGGAEHPFVVTDLAGLEGVLRRLIGLGPQRLAEIGAGNRRWMEMHWQPAELIERNFLPLIQRAIARGGTIQAGQGTPSR